MFLKQQTTLPLADGKKYYVSLKAKATAAGCIFLNIGINGSNSLGLNNIFIPASQSNPTVGVEYTLSTVFMKDSQNSGNVAVIPYFGYPDAATQNGKP